MFSSLRFTILRNKLTTPGARLPIGHPTDRHLLKAMYANVSTRHYNLNIHICLIHKLYIKLIPDRPTFT